MSKLVDEYEHVSSNIFYVSECIPFESDPAIVGYFNTQIDKRCFCSDLCNKQHKCPCLGEFENYTFTSELVLNQNAHSKKMLIECNDRCKCRNYCGNRLVQYGPRANLKIKETETKGYGLFTDTFIPYGAFVCEYAGEVIPKSEAIRRQEFNKQNGKMNYIFYLNEYCENKLTQTIVDPSEYGNIGRYINHSCKPNCHIVPIRVNIIVPMLCIFTLRNISASEEITYDYGAYIYTNVNNDKPLKECMCLANSCRKFLPFENTL